MAAEVLCAACGSANEDERKFCGECGSWLATACPSCGTQNPPGVKFCGECGAALATVLPPPSASTAKPSASPIAERRLVSVLFADLVGYTALSEGRDFEDVRDLKTRYFGTARTVIERYGGTVEKFIGDAVMAVWVVRPSRARTTPSGPFAQRSSWSTPSRRWEPAQALPSSVSAREC